jgi:DNA-binding beta-propeller fold protein YncE
MTGAAIAPDVPVAEEPPVPVEETPEDRKRRRRRAFLLFFLLALLALLVLLATWYLLFRQPLPIIPPIPDAQLPGYRTSLYGAPSPTGVAVTPSGDRIYVTENSGDYTTRIFDAGGTVIGTLAFPPETGTDHVPVYVAIDPLTTEVYVSDRPTGTIHIFDRDGQYQRQFTPAEALPGWQPLGMTFDDAGNLYVTELRGPGQRVLVFDRTGAVIREIGAAEALDFPNGVAVDDAGNVWVTDSNNGRLLVFDPEGKVIARVGRGTGAGKLGLPRGVAIDGQGRVFVVDSTGNGVVLYRAALGDDARAPEYVGFFGGQGVADGKFAFPIGVAVDDRGRIYVADTANGRVQVWSY